MTRHQVPHRAMTWTAPEIARAMATASAVALIFMLDADRITDRIETPG